MLSDSPHAYRLGAFAQDRYASQVAAEETARIAILNSARVLPGSFPLLTLGDLAHRSGVNYWFLREVIGRAGENYRPLKVRSGKRTRTVYAPVEQLARAQRWVNTFVLGSAPMSAQAHAYVRGRSITSCARLHCRSRWMLKTDLHDFFSSIDETMVYREFLRLGYNSLLAFELARLTTFPVEGSAAVFNPPHDKYGTIPSYLWSGRLGVLPQGAPTSGALANLAVTGLDSRLQGWALQNGFVYTRYSDDMVFSHCGVFDRDQARTKIGQVHEIIRAAGLRPHFRKTQIVSPGGRKVVLGLLVDGDHPRMLPEFKRRVKHHVRGVGLFGLEAHSRHRGFRSVFGLVRHVDGLIAYAAGVEPAWASVVREEWLSALRLEPAFAAF